MAVGALAAITGAAAAAQEQRGLEAHVHGVAEIESALDGDRLLVTFSSPLVNLVGFEHAPRDAAEQAALDDALEALRTAAIVAPSERASCILTSAETPAPELAAPGRDHDEAGAPGADEHDHEDGGHADIAAMYLFTCENADALTTLALPLFDRFPGVRSVHATFLGDGVQVFRELTAGQDFDLHD
jgi:hypothetical protein